MKLLFDENLSPRLVQALEPEYPGSAHVRTLGLRGATDGAIWELARQEAYAIVKEARQILAANLKPGVVPGVALEASDAFLKSKGCPPEARVAGHGQGLDLVERPVVRPEETAKLQAGMVISLHPTAKT